MNTIEQIIKEEIQRMLIESKKNKASITIFDDNDYPIQQFVISIPKNGKEVDAILKKYLKSNKKNFYVYLEMTLNYKDEDDLYHISKLYDSVDIKQFDENDGEVEIAYSLYTTT